MKIDGVATIQHYVPQFLIKSFKMKKSKKDQVYVVDKKNKKTFKSHARNLAAERYFYNFQLEEKVITLENELGVIESRAKLVIDRIKLEKSLADLSEQEKFFLAEFICIQYLRTKNKLEAAKNMINELVDKFAEWGIPDYQNFDKNLIDEKNKLIFLINLQNLTRDFLPTCLDKQWFLMQSMSEKFCLSDVGVILRNTTKNPKFGDPDMGFLSTGVEIYLPISPDLCLVGVCPSLLPQLSRHKILKHYDMPGATIIGAIEKQSYFNVDDKFVDYLNILQLYRCEKFVFSDSAENLDKLINLLKNKGINSPRYGVYNF